MKRKGIIISIIGIIIVALSLLGITFGYYYTRIFGNENATSVKVTSAMKAVKYIELSEEVSGTVIKPGYEYIKTFAATSLSTEEAIYHIYLDDVINEFTRTQDITYTLYRKSGNNTIDTSDLSDCEEISSGIFPKTNSYIKFNEKLLTKGDSYTYALKINYLESTEEQDIDDGKTFGFKVQIHSEIENPYVGDKTTLAYNIINNAKIGATGTTLASVPETNVAVDISGAIGTGKYTLAALPASMMPNGFDSWLYADTEAGASNGSSASGKSCSELVGKYIYDESLSFVFKVESCEGEVPVVNQEINDYETVLSVAQDDLGTSYYYRGNVTDNYLEFNGYCWRIVRIEGDGSIKITLAATKTCSSITSSDTGTALIRTVNYGYTQGKVTNSSGQLSTNDKSVADYVNGQTNNKSSMKYRLEAWLTSSGIDTSKLKEDNWCLGNTTDPYDNSGTLLTSTVNDLMYNSTSFYYDTNVRLYGRGQTANATLRCDGKNYKTHKSYIGALTADEVVFAGGKAGTLNTNYYLTANASGLWWTLSPSFFSSFFIGESEEFSLDCPFSVKEYGDVDSSGVYASGLRLRPAVTLSSGTVITGGNGTKNNPYVVG